MRDYLRVAFNRIPIATDRRSGAMRWLHQAISVPARWRLDHDFYAVPVEVWLKNALGRVLEPPKPSVDAQQLSAEPVTC